MSEGTPVRIDRAALERIIQRAAELQTAERDIGDSLTPDEVMALGQEVGIPGRYLQQALLEERTRVAVVAPSGFWARAVGPGEVTAQRVVRGDTGSVERSLLRWMERQELLRVQRHQPGRISWEPLGGISAAVRRSAAAIGQTSRPFMLARAESVTAVVVRLELTWSHVVLTAASRKVRGEYVGGGAALATAGIAGAGLLVALHALLLLALLPIPLGLGIGYGLVRRYPPLVTRLHLGLERALDHLEEGSGKPPTEPPARGAGVLELLMDEVRKALKS